MTIIRDNTQAVDQQQEVLQQDPATITGSRAQIIYDSADTSDNDLDLEDSVDDETELEEGEDLSALLEDEDTPEDDAPDDGSEDYDPKFSKTFEKEFGMTVEEAKELVQSLAQERAERGVRQQQEALASHWGVPQQEVERRLIDVRTYWEKLPEEKQRKLDNVEGAKAIWAKISNGKTTTPKMDRTSGKTPGGSSKYLYSQKQIDKMPQHEYDAQADQIAAAYAAGRVKR